MNKFLILFLFFLCLSNASHAVKPDTWLSQNTFQIENIKITRPSTHWRILNTDLPCLTRFRYNKFKSNVNIDVCRHPEITIKRRWNDKMTQKDKKNLIQNMLSPYRAEGYKFFKTHLELTSLTAQGVNKNNEIVFLHYLFTSDSRFKNPVVVEMKVPQKYYVDFKMAFQAVADSLVTQ